MLTVISWYESRRARKALHELVARLLTDRPTLLAIAADRYTNEAHLHPFVQLADHFGDRLQIIVAAEWEQPDRERDGEVLLQKLGLAAQVRPRLLRDEGEVRRGVVLRRKEPVALIDLFFLERGTPFEPGPDPRGDELRKQEAAIISQLEQLLVRIPPQPPPPIRALQPGEHDFGGEGLCRACGEGRATLKICAGKRVDEGPKRDRFELIELE